MVGRFFAFAFVSIDLYRPASPGKRGAEQKMIDPHPPPAMKRAAAIIPPSVNAAFRVMQAHSIRKSPFQQFSECSFFRFAE